MTTGRTCAVGLMLVAVTVMGCGDSPTSPSDLTDRTWRLVSIEPESGPATVVTDQLRYWVEFLDETRLSARADCNTCTGGYSVSGTTASIGPLACTRAFCGETSLDTVFVQGLTDATTISIDEQLLEIKSAARTLKFRAE